MNSELLQTYTPKHEETGEPSQRDEVHRLGLWHEAIHIWMIDAEGNVLLQKRSPQKSTYADVLHASVAGHVKQDSTPIQTAIEETGEELGLSVTQEELNPMGVFSVAQEIPETGHMDREHLSVYIFQQEELSIDSLKLQEEEVGSVRLAHVTEIEREILNPDTRSKYLNHPLEYYLTIIEEIKAYSDLN